MQARGMLYLLAQIRRCVQKEPVLAIATDGETGLSAGLCRRIKRAGPATGRRVGIPLRKTAARRRPQNDGLHGKSGLDLSASVAVDFTTQRDFHDFRGVPGHTSLLFMPAVRIFPLP